MTCFVSGKEETIHSETQSNVVDDIDYVVEAHSYMTLICGVLVVECYWLFGFLFDDFVVCCDNKTYLCCYVVMHHVFRKRMPKNTVEKCV